MKGVVFGINGIWSRETDSAALLSSSPLGNSMKGPSISAVLESLKRARKYFGLSFLLALLTALVIYLELTSVELPFPRTLEVSVEQFNILAMVFSTGLLVLSKSFMDDAFEGMQYLEDRESAMQVGSFPWPITRFTGGHIVHKLTSYLIRIVLTLHPIVYIFVVHYDRIIWYEVVLASILFLLSAWILVSSQRFQKPILFDRETEKQPERDALLISLNRLKKLLKEQNRKIDRL